MINTVLNLTRGQKSGIFLLLDMALVPLAFQASWALHTNAPTLQGGVHLWAYMLLLSVAAGVLSAQFGLARIQLKDYSGGAVIRSAALAAALAAMFGLLSVIDGTALHPGVLIIFGLVYFVLYFGMRQLLFWTVTQIYRRSSAVTRIAIYGAGQSGVQLARELRGRANLMAYAFLDDNAMLRGMNLDGLPVFAGIHAKRVAERYKIDRVIMAMPTLSESRQALIARRLEAMGLEVLTLPYFAQLIGDEEIMGKLVPTSPANLLTREPLDVAMTAGLRAYEGAAVLISGAGGSIGLELCRQVVTCAPRKMVLFELSELALYTAQTEIAALAESAGIEIVPVLGSIADQVLVAQVLATQGIDIVLHAAAYKHVPLVETNARAGVANNVLGTAVLAREARDAGVKRFVLVSSDKAVRPGNLMGASKRMAELILQDLAERSNQTIFSIVRFGNVLGSSGSVVPLFQDQIARGGPVTLTDERVTRYFMTIQEASRLVLLAGSFAAGGEVFVLDMGKPVRIGDLARRLIKVAGYTVRDADNPDGDIEIITTGLRPGEKLHEELSLRKGMQTTAHPKIIRVREDHLSEIEVASALRDLREAIEAGRDEGVIEVVARMVREYVPQSLPGDAPQIRIAGARKAPETPAE